jgi:hypothetical protein
MEHTKIIGTIKTKDLLIKNHLNDFANKRRNSKETWLSYEPGEEILAGMYRRRAFLNAYYFTICLKGRQTKSP